MKKEELIKAVRENPHYAMGLLTCYGGYSAGHGQIQYGGKWTFIPNNASGNGFEPKDSFVDEVIWDNRKKLWKRYK